MPRVTTIEKKTAIANDPNIILPPGEELIKQWKQTFKAFPDIKPKQAQAIELIADYVKRGFKVKYASICRKIGMDYRTFMRYLDQDVKFGKAIDIVMTQYGLTALSIGLGRISTKLINDTTISPWMFDILGRATGRIQQTTANINIQNNIVTNINPDGSISFESEDRE